jgi:diguanylate cyclase (GGDEF)-like protein
VVPPAQLDPRSIAAATTLSGLLLCAILAMVHRDARSAPSTRSWLLACASVSLGLWIHADAASVAPLILLIVANLLLNSAPALIWHGVRSFAGKPAPLWPVALTLLFSVVWSWMFGFVAPNHAIRVIAFSLLIGAWALAAANEFLRLPDREMRGGIVLTSVPLLFFGVVMIARATQAVMFGVASVSTRTTPATTVTYLAGSFALLSSMVGTIICINTRLATDIRRLAFEDMLTGALSRRGLYDALPRWLTRHARGATVTLIDLDYFKSVNDQLGHAAGDDLLRVLADTCRTHVPKDGLFARMGGDEFVLLLPTKYDAEAIVAMITGDFALAASAALDLSDINPKPGISLGVAPLNGLDADAFDAAAREADRALYRLKGARGRDARHQPLRLESPRASDAAPAAS